MASNKPIPIFFKMPRNRPEPIIDVNIGTTPNMLHYQPLLHLHTTLFTYFD